MAQEIITLENLAAEIAKLRGELATWKALAIKQDRLSTAQMLAVNSGATAGKIAQIATNTSDIAALQQIASSAFRVVKVAQLPASGESYIMYLVPQTDGETLNYCNEYLWIDNAWELVGTTGAMANNGELQIIVNGVTVGTFTANQAANSTASITVPTDTSQLTNGAGYVDATALATALASKQDSLSLAQLAAVNSGITSADVAQIGANTTAIAGKQDALTTSQLAAANSGITSADVTQIGTNTGNIATNSAAIVSLQGSKQNTLSAAQLLAVNSGITSSLVTQIGTNQSDITTLNTALGQSLTPSADDTYSLGGASFRYANVYAVTFTGDLTGTASKAIADEDGTSIKTGYVNVAGNQTVTGNKTWSGNNTWGTNLLTVKDSAFTKGTSVTDRKQNLWKFTDSNDSVFGIWEAIQYTSGIQGIRLNVTNKYKNGALDPTGNDVPVYFEFLQKESDGQTILKWGNGLVANGIYPLASYELGNAAYQWSSVYAQTYYYNGTAWGLDKANVWTGSNKFKSANTNLGLQSTVAEAGSTTLSSNWISWLDKNGFQDAYISRDIWNDGSDTLRIQITGKRDNGAPSTTGSNVECGIRLDISANGSKSVIPFTNGDTDLGNSAIKFKTLNGVNPGALSLPKNSNSASFNIDTTNWTTDGSIIIYTPLLDGWLYINARNDDTNGDSFIIFDDAVSSFGTSVFGNKGLANSGVGLLCLMMPVNKNNAVNIRIKSPGIISARIYPCNGNV